MAVAATLTLDRAELQQLADDLGLMPAAIDRAIAQALNDVAPTVMARAQQKIVSRVNLSAAYLDARTQLAKATVTRPVAVITARERATRLATYMAVQRIIGAPRAKGDPLRGIGKGFKQAGVTTGVKVGNRKLLSKAFLIPLRAGNIAGGNGLGIFQRTGPGRKDIRHLYGPSVNQLYSGVVTEMQEPITQQLEDSVLDYVIAALAQAAGAA